MLFRSVEIGAYPLADPASAELELSVSAFSARQAGLQARVVSPNSAIKLSRRQLNLEILPGFHPAEDRRGIARVRIESRLRDLRLEEYATQGTATTEVRLTPQDRARLIPRLFEKRFDTGSAAPAAGTLDPESMEQRLIEIERVQPEDLHALATRRAELVRDALARAGVDPSRITIAPEGSGHEGEGKPRVTFRLQ